MLDIVIFAEDTGHESFIKPLVERLAKEAGIPISIKVRNSTGGYGKVLSEFESFLKDVEQNSGLPDLIIIATDSNCKGVNERRRAILEKTPDKFKQFVIHAIPEPHIERWMLIDPKAFKIVFGKGCKAPDAKCDRGRYKDKLRTEIKNAGKPVLLGGIEYASDLVENMDLDHLSSDKSFQDFVSELKRKLHAA